MTELAAPCCCGGYGFCQAPVTINAEGRCAWKQITLPGLIESHYSCSATWINVKYDPVGPNQEWEGIFEYSYRSIYQPIPGYTDFTKYSRIHMKGTQVLTNCTNYLHACYEDSPPEGDGWNNRVISPKMPTTIIEPDPDNPPLYRYRHVGGEIVSVDFEISGTYANQPATRDSVGSSFCNNSWIENTICKGSATTTDPSAYLRYFWTVHAWNRQYSECDPVPQFGPTAPPPSFPYSLRIVDNSDIPSQPNTMYTEGHTNPFDLWYRELDGSVEAVGRFKGFKYPEVFCENCDPYPNGKRTPYPCGGTLKDDACSSITTVIDDYYSDIQVT